MTLKNIINKIRQKLPALFAGNNHARIPSPPLSAAALMVYALINEYRQPVVIITDGRHTLDRLHRDLETMSPYPTEYTNENLLYFPAAENIFDDIGTPDPEITGYRRHTLEKLYDYRESTSKSDASGNHPAIVATCIQAILQPTLSIQSLSASSVNLQKGNEIEIDKLMLKLAEFGYNISFEVTDKGEACSKGGIIDVWPVTEVWPVRLEFFGNELESIRMFNPVTQRSIGFIDEISIPIVKETPETTTNGQPTASLLEHLPDNSIFFWLDYDLIVTHAELLTGSATDAGNFNIFSLQDIKSKIENKPGVKQLYTSIESALTEESKIFQFEPISIIEEYKKGFAAPDIKEAARHKLLKEICNPPRKSHQTIIYMETGSSKEHLQNEIAGFNPQNIKFLTGTITGGFTAPQFGFSLVSESDIYGKQDTAGQRYIPAFARNGPSKLPSTRITELSDIEPGDLVVHIEHGLGRYLGLFNITMRGREQEVISVEYADNTKLHIPVTQAHLISKYVGIASHNVRLHTLGGKRWNKEKNSAQSAVVDIAASLIEMQAARAALEGIPFPDDTAKQHEFEATFPYRETEDQIKVIADIKQDMESARPMDRLICGDAGYGKTEVAIRAAFKAVMSDKQVAVLVPTTILAQQHFETFSNRMAGYHIQIEMLSRFRTKKEKERIITELKTGDLDIVIGTHALLQDNIQFADLGLVIIDEEQKFGVVHKEKLKKLRQMVDVLTMTATPIPRTMYMSLTGARDISIIQTPPKERMAIETIVTKDDDNIIRKAILRELNREGQVFFLHNRVLTINKVYERLKKLVPEASIEIAHGQMPTTELETVMHNFTTGKFDILLCTTIIESGMDIPRVNTIIIDRADRFGIAGLYQLRGRVGRSNIKAYAYLLIPKHGHIEADAQRRIAAIKKFSGLGSGYNLAMRDLEIRGAGNLLGASQSGHINAIGFGLYCQLLNRTIARMQNKPLPPLITVNINLDFIDHSAVPANMESAATIPYNYIEDERLRIETYHKLAEATTNEKIRELQEEINDRFGKLPQCVTRLFKLAELRILAAANGITSIDVKEGKLVLHTGTKTLMTNNRYPRLQSTTPDAMLQEIAARIQTIPEWSNRAT